MLTPISMPTASRHCWKQAGIGLIELMVTLVIGLIIMLALTSVASSTIGANAQQMRETQVNTELRNALHAIARDVRRAAYVGTGSTTSLLARDNTAFVTALGNEPALEFDDTTSTLTIRYRVRDNDANVTVFNYRRNNSGAIEFRIGTDDYQAITDANRVSVSVFNVDVGSSGTGAVVSTWAELTLSGQPSGTGGVSRSVAETVHLRNLTPD